MILIDGANESRLDALDRGFAYGDGVFRTMRVRSGNALCWSQHYEKLSADCARLALECPAEDLLRAEVMQVAATDTECVVKVIVTRGSGGRGYAPPPAGRPRRWVAGFPAPHYPPDRAVAGVRLRWCRTGVTVQPALAGVKHLNRLDSVLARGEWSGEENAEGLMLDPSGHVIQGTMTNVFILEGSRLVTPVLDCAGVAGVQRGRLMTLAGACGLTAAVERITPERLLASDQVLVVNSVIGAWWAHGLAQRTWVRRDVTAALIERLAEGEAND